MKSHEILLTLGLTDDVEPAEATPSAAPEADGAELESRGAGARFMDKYQWLLDGAFLGVSIYAAYRGIKYLWGG